MVTEEDEAVLAEMKRENLHSNDGIGICERCSKRRKLSLRYLICKKCAYEVFGREY